jgi:hypothetical protein
MLDVLNGNIMRFFMLFSNRKKQNQTGNRLKGEKKRENEQIHFGQNSILFGCANSSPNSATRTLDH